MLLLPILSKCANRRNPAKVHPTSGSPEDWLNNKLLLKSGLFGISFDFFVDWSAGSGKLGQVVWIKRILPAGFIYQDVCEDLHRILMEDIGEEYLNRICGFASIFGFNIEIVIIRDDYNWSEPSSSILLIEVEMSLDGDLNYKNSILTIAEFKSEIQKLSGGPVRIGPKGLTYGTSRLECFLSGTDSAYPGDVDLIIIGSDNLPDAIIEFKKHTKDSPMKDQKLSNYYPKPDGRKYDRLALLRDFVSNAPNQVPIIIIYFPTGVGTTEGSLELIRGPVGKLNTAAVQNFNLPSKKEQSEFEPIVKIILKAIENHKRSWS